MSSVVITPQAPEDLFRLAHAGFSQETVYRRFHSAKPRLSRRDTRYFGAADGVDHLALIATDADTDEIAGVVRLIRSPGETQRAEMAIMVCDDFQGRGVGRQLLERVAVDARAVGIATIVADTQSDNYAFMRLFQNVFPDATTRRDGSSVEFQVQITRLRLAPPVAA